MPAHQFWITGQLQVSTLDGPTGLDTLQTMFQEFIMAPTTYAEEAWSAYLDKAVKEFRVWPSRIPLGVTVVVKPSEAAWWMDSYDHSYYAYPQEAWDWKERTGWPFESSITSLRICGAV
jgi:hypothetical protein